MVLKKKLRINATPTTSNLNETLETIIRDLFPDAGTKEKDGTYMDEEETQ